MGVKSPLIYIILALLLLAYIQITIVGSSNYEQRVIGDLLIPSSLSHVRSNVIELNRTLNERVVNAFNIGDNIVLVTSKRVISLDTANLSVLREDRISKGSFILASYDANEGVIYIALYEGSNISTTIYKYTPVGKLVKFKTVRGYPRSLDSNNGTIALIVDNPGTGIQLWVFSRNTEWDIAFPKNTVDPTLLKYVKVAVSPKGMVAFSYTGMLYESIIVFDRGGSPIYNQSLKKLYSTGQYLYSSVSWSPEGNMLAFLGYNKTEGTLSLAVLDVLRREILWSRTVGYPANPSEGIIFNPTGCCLYYQSGSGSYLVYNASNGVLLRTVDWRPFVTRIYGWTGNGVWGVVARKERLAEIGFVGMMGAPLIRFQQNPLIWQSIVNRAVATMPINAGFLDDGEAWVVQEYFYKVRIALIDWPRYAIAYFDPGPYKNYFWGLTLKDQSGFTVHTGWFIPLFPDRKASITYTLNAKTKMWVRTVLGVDGFIVGDPNAAKESWNVSLNTEPLQMIHINISEKARSLVSHITLEIPGPCIVKRLVVRWGKESYVFSDIEKHRIILVALRGYYNITAEFREDRFIIRGNIEPTRLHLIVWGGEDKIIKLLPRGIVIMLRGSQRVYLLSSSGNVVKHLFTTENWTGYCVPPGNYTLMIKPRILGLVAPSNWSITINLTGDSKIVWIDTDKLFEDKLANLIIINTANTTYLLDFYVKSGEEYIPVRVSEIYGGESLEYKILVGLHYKLYYYKESSSEITSGKEIEFVATHPGENITIKIPIQAQQSHVTQTTSEQTSPQTAAENSAITSKTQTTSTTVSSNTPKTASQTSISKQGGGTETIVIVAAAGTGIAALALILYIMRK